MFSLGQIAYAERDFSDALQWFTRASKADHAQSLDEIDTAAVEQLRPLVAAVGGPLLAPHGAIPIQEFFRAITLVSVSANSFSLGGLPSIAST